jgi:hypothetical protein
MRKAQTDRQTDVPLKQRQISTRIHIVTFYKTAIADVILFLLIPIHPYPLFSSIHLFNSFYSLLCVQSSYYLSLSLFRVQLFHYFFRFIPSIRLFPCNSPQLSLLAPLLFLMCQLCMCLVPVNIAQTIIYWQRRVLLYRMLIIRRCVNLA